VKFADGSYASTAIDYAKRVVTGKIPACWQLRASCQRTLDDLKRRDIVFSEKHIDHACAFIEALPHTKGDLAGSAIILEPFQIWIIANLFGFVRKADSLRKHRAALILLPRKMGKSILAAGIGLYMAFADNEPGAEVYCGASSLAQANEVFTPAKRMAEMSPHFREAFGVDVMSKSIFCEETGQSFIPVIGKTKDGSSPHCAIADEAHQHKDDTQIQAFRTGMGARSQPLLLIISTAGYSLTGICRQEQLEAESVLKGATKDDQLFSAIYTIDPNDDWRDFEVWRKANPNMGVSVSEEYLRGRYEKALQSPSKQAEARTKYLNEWVSSASGWLNMVDWSNAADTSIDIDALKGRKAWIGVDFGTRNDLTAIVAVIPLDDGRKAFFPWLFLPEGAVSGSPNAQSYTKWAADGDLILTEGAASSFKENEQVLFDLTTMFDVQEIVFDKWQGENSRQTFEAAGYNTSIWGTGSTYQWTMAMDDLEAELKRGELAHSDNPVMNWCAGNTCAWRNGVSKQPVKPQKDGPQKIDGMVAAIMAHAIASKTPLPPPAPLQMFFLD
jgi:phage terminase large subunit-like protein